MVNSLVRRFRKVLSRCRVRLATWIFKIRRGLGLAGRLETSNAALPENLTGIMSLKCDRPERVAILSAILAHYATAMNQSRVALKVLDGSVDEFSRQTKQLFGACASPIEWSAGPERLPQAYLKMLQNTSQPYFYLQFDDFISVGLTPKFLAASCELMRRYAGLVNVISVEWPVEVKVDDRERSVDVVAYEVSQQRYHFGIGEPQTPAFIETVDGFRFAIFENFQYGFFFHNLIANTRDFATRLEWYMRHVSPTSAHAIETAAAQRICGPFWTHLAVNLDGVSLLDLDFAQTRQDVRPETARNAPVFRALQAGYALRSFVRADGKLVRAA